MLSAQTQRHASEEDIYIWYKQRIHRIFFIFVLYTLSEIQPSNGYLEMHTLASATNVTGAQNTLRCYKAVKIIMQWSMKMKIYLNHIKSRNWPERVIERIYTLSALKCPRLPVQRITNLQYTDDHYWWILDTTFTSRQVNMTKSCWFYAVNFTTQISICMCINGFREGGWEIC